MGQQTTWLLFFVAYVVSTTLSIESPRSYSNYSVYIVYLRNSHQEKVLDNLLEQHKNYNLWHRTVQEMHIMVSPQVRDEFLQIMAKENMHVKLNIPNVQQ
ncbi:hypothetical protein KR018_000175 [Drosophila ironensis]|nr:hypothetical protein KR018_000175 [Drosophila ironensis]